jgi:chromosome segregation ATPase
MKIKKLE